ncbi:hypothetical protein LPJ64_001920 [Coemansia asiatica]|uniref:protein-serine/threonine phosphatase n=1 Tax=Coemansia asiatica TaxID=1052880 RepID=A0A9W7XN40_9FUNG|nr:hypothetical protein LPJ64_001920 [Coemansia asiatica]
MNAEAEKADRSSSSGALPQKRPYSEEPDNEPRSIEDNESPEDNESAESHRDVAADDEMVRESLSLEITWKGSKKYQLRIPKYATVLSVKVLIEELTEIDSDSQKLLGLVKGKLPKDSDTLVDLGVADGTKIRLVGTRMADRLKALHGHPLRESAENNDVTGISPDIDYPWETDAAGSKRMMERSQVISTDWKPALDKIVQTADIRLMNPPRQGKKLVVLDLDYTLFDCKNISGNVADMARPGLHEFLSAIYPQYDLIIWSQTKWHVVESKITLLGMLTHPLYRITTALDISTMLTVKAVRGGQVMTHQVKPLQFIWTRFPDHYNQENTIHIDDLGRNFALNYQNGLKVKQFKRADTKPRSDKELFRLAAYLLKIAALPSFDGLNHSQWHSYQ